MCIYIFCIPISNSIKAGGFPEGKLPEGNGVIAPLPKH